MSDDEDVMMDDEPIPTLDKGKGKALDPPGQSAPYGEDNLPWVEKYRPVTLDDVVSHKDITTTIEKFIEKNRLPHLLFYGPPGTGKTSTILAMARKIYGDGYKKQILELNASDDRGIDVVRLQIKNFAETRTLFARGFKLVVLDEADAMTQAAQAALRRVIEQHTRNVRFCIICNYVGKIAPAVQSRCTRFRFSPLPEAEVSRRVESVIAAEKVDITPDGRAALLKLARGDMRRALNVLQACHAAYARTSETEVYNCTGAPHPRDIATVVHAMLADEFTSAYQMITALKTERGLALQDLVTGAYDYLDTLELKPHARAYLLDALATTEHRLSAGASEKMQLTALLAAFKEAVEMSGNAK